MPISVERAHLIRSARKVDKALFVDRLTEEQYLGIVSTYYKEMAVQGFHTDMQVAKDKGEFYFMKWQQQFGLSIIRSVFMKEKTTLNLSCCRQVGKTTLSVATVEFCFNHFFEIFGEPFRVAIIAPEGGTAKEIFQRLKQFILKSETDLAVDRSDEVETIAGDRVQIFGIYHGSKTVIEGRTHHLVLRDEASYGDDSAFLSDVLPTTNRTGGSIINIGNGGFSDCYFYRNLQKGNSRDGKNIVIIKAFNDLLPEMQSMADFGLPSSQEWIDATYDYIALAGGRESLYVKKNIYCEWVLDISQFITQSSIDACETTTTFDLVPKYYLSYDCAFSGKDRSVACVMDANRNLLDYWILKDIGEMKTLEDQARELRYRCDEMGIMDNLVALGVDSSGLGIGMAESIEKTFPTTEIVRFTFATKAKMDWYLALRDSILATQDSHRIKINRDLLGYGTKDESVMSSRQLGVFLKEMVDLEVTPTRNGLMSFSAPKSGVMLGKSVNDDGVAASAMCLSLIGRHTGFMPTLGKEFRKIVKKFSGNSIQIAKSACAPFLEPSSSLPISSGGPKLAKFRKLARSGVSPWQ